MKHPTRIYLNCLAPSRTSVGLRRRRHVRRYLHSVLVLLTHARYLFELAMTQTTAAQINFSIKRRRIFTKADSTLRSSQAVPHPSTNRALCRLTSEVERDPVYSTRYGRQRKLYCNNAQLKVKCGGGGCQSALLETSAYQCALAQQI